MIAMKSINNNTALCKDSNGKEIIAMGKGIGFGKFPREIPLEEIERTFYDIADNYQTLLYELPSQVLEFAGQIVEIARNELPYDLSPNLVVTLADHLTFAIERAQKRIHIKMFEPYDVKQCFPKEWKLGEYTVRRMRREFKVALPDEEIVGIAMSFLNSKITDDGSGYQANKQDQEMLEDITEIVENTFHMVVNRESFNYARYATHMNYLFQRLHTGQSIASENLQIYHSMRKEFPEIAGCVDLIVAHIQKEWNCNLSEEEKLYLILHVNRICIPENS